MADRDTFAKGEAKTLALDGNDGAVMLSFQRTDEYVYVHIDDDFVGQITHEDFDDALKRMRHIWPPSSPPPATPTTTASQD